MSGKESGACACVCEEVGGEKKPTRERRESERLEVNGGRDRRRSVAVGKEEGARIGIHFCLMLAIFKFCGSYFFMGLIPFLFSEEKRKKESYSVFCLQLLPFPFLVSFLLRLSSIQPIFCTCTWTPNPVCLPLPSLSNCASVRVCLSPSLCPQHRLEIVLAGRRAARVGKRRGGQKGERDVERGGGEGA